MERVSQKRIKQRREIKEKKEINKVEERESEMEKLKKMILKRERGKQSEREW